MSREGTARVVRALTSRGYNADRDAVTLLANAPDPEAAVERAVAEAPEDALTVTATHVRAVLEDGPAGAPAAAERARADDGPDRDPDQDRNGSPTTTAGPGAGPDTGTANGGTDRADTAPPATGTGPEPAADTTPDPDTDPDTDSDPEPGPDPDTEGDGPTRPADTQTSTGGHSVSDPTESGGSGEETGGFEGVETRERSPREPEVSGDVTGRSTGTGEYEEFVSVFRDRYERLSGQLRGRVNHRPTDAVESMPGGSEAAIVGMVNDIRSTAGGHWLVELEDTNGVFPTLVMKDRDLAPVVDELLLDEVVAVEGTLADDGGILFVDELHFPDVPRTNRPSTADRRVEAALVSDIHVGSQEFMADAWERFADWLSTPAAEHVEYLLVAGDMVEGVGVYPDQDEELEVVDIYEQYERFSEHLKSVPGDIEVVMIPGNHDAVRLAEPQPAFDEELRDVMTAHDARVVGNPSTVTLEGVDVLMYHGVSIDEVVAELPGASYDAPAEAMSHLLRKRHLAPTYGGKNRIAPESRDYLVIDEIPDVLHCGHVHTLGVGEYHGVRTVNSACWQAQTPFQRSVNIQPDPARAPILDLQSLEVTVRKFH